MTDFAFQLLVLLSLLVTVAGIVAEDLGARGLPEHLRVAKVQMKALTVASSKATPLVLVLRVAIVVGYLVSLVAIAFFVPFSPWGYLFFTACWSLLAVADAPHILPRLFVPLYETSLLLNGAILALCFWSPLGHASQGSRLRPNNPSRPWSLSGTVLLRC